MTSPTTMDVKIPSPEFMDDYDTGARYVPPPQPKEWVDGKVGGKTKFVTFVAQAPSVDNIKTKDDQGQPLKTADGYFKGVLFGVTLPNNGNYEVQQTHIGTAQYKQYDRKTNKPIEGKFRNASPALDYFRAFGIESKPTEVSQYVDLFEATAGRQAEIQGDWSAYDSEQKTDVARKWEDFPDEYVNENGAVVASDAPGARKSGRKQPFIERNGKRFWARFGIKRWISTVEEKK